MPDAAELYHVWPIRLIPEIGSTVAVLTFTLKSTFVFTIREIQSEEWLFVVILCKGHADLEIIVNLNIPKVAIKVLVANYLEFPPYVLGLKRYAPLTIRFVSRYLPHDTIFSVRYIKQLSKAIKICERFIYQLF